MGEIIAKIMFFIIVLPSMIITEGYEMFKKFLKKNNLSPTWEYVLLIVLVLLLLVLLLFGYS